MEDSRVFQESFKGFLPGSFKVVSKKFQEYLEGVQEHADLRLMILTDTEGVSRTY